MLRLLRGAVLAGVIAPLASILVPAAPPEAPDPQLTEWFQSLRQPGTGTSCCDLSDCRPVGARVSADGYEVLLTPGAFPVAEERWVSVPPHVILQGKDNPIGRAVVCWTPSKGVLCFVRPTET
jgi:hypothetical protein